MARAYRTHTSSGYEHARHTEVTEVPGTDKSASQKLTEVLCRVIPGVNAPGTVSEYRTEHNLAIFL